MTFDDVLEILLRDDRTRGIPILYIIQTVIILDDLNLFKEELSYATESN